MLGGNAKFPEIENLKFNVGLRTEILKPWAIILNRVGENDGEAAHGGSESKQTPTDQRETEHDNDSLFE